jgi:hypothetical protein
MDADWQVSPDPELVPDKRGWSPIMRGAIEKAHDRAREALELMQ